MLSELELQLLISSGENERIDFKEKHHECNGELIHDILCLINSDSLENKYIIYGINDSGKIIGVEDDKKATQGKLVNLIHGSNFNSKPSIEIKDYFLEGKKINVLEIKRGKGKPYFILEDKLCGRKCNKHTKKDFIVRAGVIYTRDSDHNTPITSTASENQIQAMWEERLGIRQHPLSRIKIYLDDIQSWRKNAIFKDSTDVHGAYYIKFPEFTLEVYESLEPTEDFNERWHQRVNGHHKLGVMRVALKYHGTILKVIELINVENKRVIPVPEYNNSSDMELIFGACISRSSLEFNIAAIIDCHHIKQELNLDKYNDSLKKFLYLNKKEFDITLV